MSFHSKALSNYYFPNSSLYSFIHEVEDYLVNALGHGAHLIQLCYDIRPQASVNDIQVHTLHCYYQTHHVGCLDKLDTFLSLYLPCKKHVY